MAGQMCWIDPNNGNGEKILHLRLTRADRWLPYTSPQFARHRQPDLSMHGIKLSKGLETARVLLKQGWVYVKSDEANLPDPETIAQFDKFSMGRAIAAAKKFGLVQ